MQQDPLGSFKVANKRRDATVTIRGYVYQVNVTLLRWIALRPGEALELEAGEDIDKIQKALADDSAMERLFEGVKHREKRLTLRSPEALGALAAFNEHRQTNSFLKLKFRYVTNAAIGIENPSVDKTKTPGIFLWEGIQSGRIKGKQKSSVIQSIRSLLKQCSKPTNLGQPVWNSFLGYLNHATPAELNRFIDAFEWSMEQGSNDETAGQVRFELANSGRLKFQEDAERAYAHLFHFVFSLLTRRSNKALTAQLLSSELVKLDQADKGLQIINHIDDLKSQVHSRLDAMEYKLDILIDRANQGGPAESPQNQHAPSGVNQSDELASSGGTALDRIDNAAGRISSPSPSIVSSALVFHNEALAAALGRRTKDQVKGLRDMARSGRRSDALKEIQSQKADRGTWHILSNESKAAFLRLEASILLGMQEDTSDARRLLEEAHQLAPNEDDSRLRACIAFFERDLETAARILEGQEQPESRNLSALFMLLSGHAQDCLERLPPLDPDKSVMAETLRIRCLAQLQTCDIANARRSIDDALAAQPDWPMLRALDARVMYYEALAPAVLPPPIDGSPDISSLIFVIDSAENRQRLREAAEKFLQLSNLTENSVEDRRSLEAWRLLCLTADRSRHEEANNYANDIFIRDPGQYRIIPWLMVQRSAGVNFAPAEKALAAEIETDPNIIFQVMSLVMVKIHQSKPTEALEILTTFRSLFIEEKNERGWQHLRSLALWRSGKSQEAKNELQQFDIEKHDPLWTEILRNEAQQSGDWNSYAQYLMNRYKSTKAPDALLDYCDFETRRKNWAAVADLAHELMTRIGTAEALRIASMANLYANRPAESLRILQLHQDLFADANISEQLHQVSIAAKTKLGSLISAKQEAEELSQNAPSTENLVILARLQLNTGDLKALAINARRLHERKDLDSGEALQLAALIRREDANLAESLWGRALAAGVSDEQIGTAISLGYRLGLDKQLQPLLIRMYALAEAGEQGIQRKTFSELLEYAKQHHEDVEWANSLYRTGEITIHLIPHNLRDQLATLYHDRLLEREDKSEIVGGGLYTRHGGRLLINGFPETAPQWRVTLDITSLLLAEHLGVLEKIAQGFGPVQLPPSIFLALTAMQYNVSTAQISQIQAAQEVIAAVENNEIIIVDLPDTFSPELPTHLGNEWLRLYEAARLGNGYIIDFLPKHDAMMEKVLDLPADMHSRLLNCRAAVEALRTNGGISDNEYANALAALGTEGALHPVGSVSQGAHLYCQSTVAKLLAHAKLIKPISRIFTLSLSRKDLEDLKAITQHHARQQQLTAWLDNLIAHLRQGTAQGKFELATVSHDPKALADKDINFDVECLLELLSVRSEPNDVICCDDRYFNAYARTESAPLISILELLKALVAAKELTIDEYYRLLVRLRAAGAFFIPLEADEILHHLSQAPRAKNIHSFETRELAIIRRYWARCLLNGQALQKPNGPHPANKDGEAYFLQASMNAIRATLTSIWIDSRWNDRREKELRSEWLLQSLQIDLVGIKCLAGLPPGNVVEQQLVGMTLGSMVLSALKEQLTDPSRLQNVKDLLQWLEDRVLQPAFDKDISVLLSTAQFIRATALNIWRSFTKEQAPYATKFVLMILELLPQTLREAVRDDDAFNREIQVKNVTAIEIGELRFFRDDYLRVAVAAVNGTTSQIQTSSAEQITVSPGNKDESPEIVLTRANGQQIIMADPLLGVLYDAIEDREKSLHTHPDWWDCSGAEQQKTIHTISTEEEPAKRIDEAQHWRDNSAAVYYNNLPQVLKTQGFILARNLRPPNAHAILRHYRLPSGTSADSFRNDLMTGLLEITAANGITDALIRYGGLPIAIPNELYIRLEALSPEDMHALVKTLMRVAGSPVSTLHFLRLLVHLSGGKKTSYRRLATRVLGHLTSELGKQERRAFQQILRWVENGFATWNYFATSPTSERLAMVWMHAHRIYATLKYLAIDLQWTIDRFGHEDFGLCHDLLEGSSDRNDVAHPRKFLSDAFLIDGLCYAIGNSFENDWTEFEKRGLIDTIHQMNNGKTIPAVELFRDKSLGSNILDTFVQWDRRAFLGSLHMEETTSAFLTENLKKEAFEALNRLVQNPAEIMRWERLFWIVGDYPVSGELRSLMESALLAIDLTTVMNNPDLCLIVLYAASLQVESMGSETTTAHVTEEMLRFVRFMQERSNNGKIPEYQRFALSMLLEISAFLARALKDAATQNAEFVRIMNEILNSYPAVASLYNSSLQHFWPCTASQAKLFWPLLIRSRAFD
jgi:hypothetical protein